MIWSTSPCVLGNSVPDYSWTGRLTICIHEALNAGSLWLLCNLFRFQDEVHLVECRNRQILVAVGQRVACFECSEDLGTSHMETIAWTPTREEITSLSVSQQGVIAAAGETQSVTLYTCTAENGFEVLCADPHNRNTVSCLAGPIRPDGLQVCTAACLTPPYCDRDQQNSTKVDASYLSSHVILPSDFGQARNECRRTTRRCWL